jgi:hypothetical protein
VIVPDDVAAWFVGQMNVSAVTAAVMGGFGNGRPPETAASPYGVFTVSREAQAEYTSAGELPRFNLSLAVFVDQTGATQAQAVQQVVANAVPIVYTGVTAMVRGGAGTIISIEPREWSADVGMPMRAKTDVVVCKAAWNVWVQGITG